VVSTDRTWLGKGRTDYRRDVLLVSALRAHGEDVDEFCLGSRRCLDTLMGGGVPILLRVYGLCCLDTRCWCGSIGFREERRICTRRHVDTVILPGLKSHIPVIRERHSPCCVLGIGECVVVTPGVLQCVHPMSIAKARSTGSDLGTDKIISQKSTFRVMPGDYNTYSQHRTLMMHDH
jgi:hypothetical protein